MKNYIAILLLLINVVLSGCNNSSSINNDVLIQEQIADIESALSSNAPVSTSIIPLDNKVANVELEARDMNYKDSHFKYLYLTIKNPNDRIYNIGNAILPIAEIDNIVENIDSLILIIGKKKADTRQQVSYISKGGIRIDLDSDPYEIQKTYGTMPSGWGVYIKASWKGDATLSISPKNLELIKQTILDGRSRLNSLDNGK